MSIQSIKGIFKDALPIIATVAPTVAKAIGGPIGIAAGYIIPILANAFGAHPSDMSTIVSNLLSDPEANAKLQTIEDEHGDWLDGLMESVNNLQHAEINIKLDWATKSP